MLLAAAVLSDVLLAVLVFGCLARPELAMGAVAWLAGLGRGWQAGTLSEGDEARLAWAARLARLPLLGLLFLWSLLVGSLMAVLRP